VKTLRPGTGIEFTLPLTRADAERIVAQGSEAAIFVMLELSARLAEQQGAFRSPSTPSGMVPPYEKPTTPKRHKKPGAKPGHAGTRRPTPPEITHRKEHPPLEQCPHCGSTVKALSERRFRLIEEVAETQPEVTEHSIPRHWCPTCAKLVEPPVPDAMPGATFGHRLIALTAWLHYGVGATLSQVCEVLNHHLHFKASQGGLVNAWQGLAAILEAWYDAIGDAVKARGVLHADETGWRVSGKTHWLWCFTTRRATYYMIDRSRGSPALSKFFTAAFDGILVTDFWAAYSAVECTLRQACLPHLFRELDKTDERDSSAPWARFSKKLKRLLHDAIRLGKLDLLPPERFASRRTRLAKRLETLLDTPSNNNNVQRLLKRLRRYRDALFTFLDHPDVPSDNNHAEREIRPAVVMRKNSLCNRSTNGAHTQAVLMSVYRTLKMRGLDPLETIVDSLRTYVRTGQLPRLPDSITSLG
jgi:transposase